MFLIIKRIILFLISNSRNFTDFTANGSANEFIMINVKLPFYTYSTFF